MRVPDKSAATRDGIVKLLALLSLIVIPRAIEAQQRAMQPADLFRIERVGAVSWSPDARQAAVEITRPGRWIDESIPTSRIAIVDARSGAMRTISSSSNAYVGFFGAAWSPTGRRLTFLSVDTNAVVRPWLWEPGIGSPKLLRGLQLHDGLVDSPIALWSDDDHALFMIVRVGVVSAGEFDGVRLGGWNA